MSDFEEADFCAQLWRLQQQREVKKECVGKKREQKRKKSSKVQADESSKKTKKECKFKEGLMERKDKKKERRKEKKKKRKKKLEREEHQTSASSNLQQKEKLSPEYLTPDFTEKIIRRKKVQFGSFPPYIQVKRPTFSSSSSKEAAAVRDSSQSCPQVTGLIQAQVQDNDSQCPSEDINSQDLFITQKTFRTPPPELSSSETSDRAVTAFPLELRQPHSKSNNNHSEDLKEFRPKAVHPYLDQPFVVTSSPYAASGQRCSLTASSTQTENFFTSELCSFFSFCQRSRAAEDYNSLKPLDLSLPQRARTALCLTTKASGISTQDGLPSPPFPADPTFFSEEDHSGRSGRREMIQTKGERLSPRPESPLMKLSQGRAATSRRRR
ncbi:uncharacterized protein LOC110013427 isoform X2 [Oryzias latipes]